MTVCKRIAPLVLAVLAAASLGACSSDSGSSSTPAPAPSSSQAAPSNAAPIPANVPGTYANRDWVIRLSADGTWEEDLRGQKNAYGGSYTVNGSEVLLRDRRGSSEKAVLQGDELRLPSITLKRQ